jgi:hypothetical protein
MATNNMVKTLLGQLGIEKIVWIDDRFSTIEDEAYERHIVSLIGEIHDHEDGAKRLGAIIEGLLDTTPPEVQEKIVHEFVKKSAGTLRTLEETLDRLKMDIGLEAKNDLSSDTFDGLIESLGAHVKKLSLGQWREISTEEKTKYSKCLFLVDRQFTREGSGANAGDEIVHEIAALTCSDYFCIMFTYTTDAQAEDAARREILGALYKRMGAHHVTPIIESFHVLSKSRIHENDAVEASFAEALKHTILRSLHGRLVGFTRGAMTTGMSETAVELTSLSIYDIDRSVFLNSLGEGASEVDVIFRLLGLGQRRKIEDMLVQNDQDLLSTLEKLRALQSAASDASGAVLTKGSPIKKWREEEILVRGEIVNGTHAPLACGDIFVKDTVQGSKAKRYVLLCQPCDLMVRSDGSSKGNEAFFVEVLEPDAGNEKNDKYKRPFYYSLEFPGGALIFDFRSWGSVSLEVLRLAVFQKDGKVAFAHGTQLPPAVHLPGWKKLFSEAQNRFMAASQGSGKNELNPAYARLSLNEKVSGRMGKGDKSSVTFPFTRERRIRTPYAEAILSSFLNYNARAAFDHDFAATGEAPDPSYTNVTNLGVAVQVEVVKAV